MVDLFYSHPPLQENPSTFQTKHGSKTHALIGRWTACNLYPQRGDRFLPPNLEVTCKKCLRRLGEET
jgi:hypothetical protein